MSYCIIFPGQGTQFLGMSGKFNLPEMPEDILRLMSDGPEEQLNLTYNAQPAILGVSIALFNESGLESPSFVMGHSLGEYTALVAADSIRLRDAIELVKKRGQYMQMCPQGAMVAVIGLSQSELEEFISPFENIWIANINGGGQTVVSGTKDSIEKALAAFRERRIKAVPLNVSVASHCPLMDRARGPLSDALEDIEIKQPSISTVFNTTARTESSPSGIRALLRDQLTNPVRWEESVKYVIGQGVDTFVEIGPKSVLAPLIKRIAPGLKVESKTLK